jgi:putative addiction module component (TIGR02574 family)
MTLMITTDVSYEQVKEIALHLPVEDRSRLASRLLESLDDDDDVSPEWLEEIRRRVKEMKDGTAKMIPHDEVMSNVMARLARSREERGATPP